MKNIWSMRHDPWVMVWPLALAQIVSWGCVFYSFSLFVTPIETDLGWTRQQLNGALTLAFLAMAGSAYPVGRWVDRYGGRRIMVVGCIAAGCLLLAMSGVHEVVEFYVLWTCLGPCMACILYEPAFVVVTQVFGVDTKRGITALTLVAGFSSTIFFPLVEFLLNQIGWRDTYVILGLMLMLLSAPLHWLFLPSRTTSGAAHSHSREADTEFSLIALCRRPLFWGIVVWSAGYSFMLSGVLFQLIPLLKSEGVTVAHVVFCMALFGPSQVAGRIAVMLIAHRISTAALGTLTVIAFPLATLVLLEAPHELAWLCLAIALFGAANGIATIVRGTAPAEWIGLADYGKVAAAITIPVLVSGALSPSILAWIWTHHGAVTMLQVIVLASLISAGGYGLVHIARTQQTTP